MDEPLIIVGIDPGTTVGWAVLNTEGDILEIGSAKHLGVEGLMERLRGVGLVVVVGCDRARAPVYVQRFAVMCGARLISPRTDISVREKQRLAIIGEPGNAHERDALAAAHFAFKRTRGLIARLKRAAEGKRAKEALETLLKQRVSNIAEAVAGDTEIIAVSTQTTSTKSPKPILGREGITARLKREIVLLKNHCQRLEQHSRNLSERLERERREHRAELEGRLAKHLSEKQREIERLRNRVRELLAELDKRGSTLNELKTFMESGCGGKRMLLRRYPDLRKREYPPQGEAIYVDKPGEVEPKNLGERVIVFKEAPGRALLNSPRLVWVDSKSIEGGVRLCEGFAMMDRVGFEKAVAKASLLQRILEGYKKERGAIN